MEVGLPEQQQQQQQQNAQQVAATERLNQAVQQQLNLEGVKSRAVSLYKAISRVLEDFDAYSRTKTTPKWQDILGQYSMINLELFNIVDEIKKVSKAFVAHPKIVTAETAAILPVMLSTKSLPEMEISDSSKRDQLLHGMQSLSISSQIENLKNRIIMIGAACESAEKVLADTRKAYQFVNRQEPTVVPTLDKGQAAKIQEQENLLRAAVNFGEGLRIPGDQRQVASSLPPHLADVLIVDGNRGISDSSGAYMKNTPPLSSNSANNQGPMLQAHVASFIGKSAASPSTATSAASFDNSSPLPYAISPRAGANMVNASSPQQNVQQQLLAQQQSQHRQKVAPLPQQQQFRHPLMQGLGQPLGHLQLQQSRQLSSVPHGLGQSQLNQANQLNRHLAQGLPHNQMFGITSSNSQRTHASQMLNEQWMSNPSSTATMMSMQQQMDSPGTFGSATTNPQGIQSGIPSLPNLTQIHPSFPQQRQNQQ